MREEEQSFNKLSKKQGRKLMNLHNNEAGRLVSVLEFINLRSVGFAC